VEWFITGGSGFLGRSVVAAALERGHRLRLLVRDRSRLAATIANHPAVTIVEGDVSSGEGLDQLAGCDGVIHLVAAMTGSLEEQRAITVGGTQNLIAAMEAAAVRRLVAVSSFSVYGYLDLAEGALLDELTALERRADRRDAYGRAKLEQEALVRRFGGQDRSGAVTVLRPGLIYGPGQLWDCDLTLKGRRFRIDRPGELPLIYVENCAEAIVLAAESEAAIGKTLNLIDDDRPSPADYGAALAQAGVAATQSIGWDQIKTLANLADGVNRAFGGKIKLPGILIPDRLHARFKPLRYSNDRAKQLLGWQPRYGLAEAIARSMTITNH
jgi:2-alkyl-3-oxoalkanoate reductase